MKKVSLKFESFHGGWLGCCIHCGKVLASGSVGIPKQLWSSCDCKEAVNAVP